MALWLPWGRATAQQGFWITFQELDELSQAASRRARFVERFTELVTEFRIPSEFCRERIEERADVTQRVAKRRYTAFGALQHGLEILVRGADQRPDLFQGAIYGFQGLRHGGRQGLEILGVGQAIQAAQGPMELIRSHQRIDTFEHIVDTRDQLLDIDGFLQVADEILDGPQHALDIRGHTGNFRKVIGTAIELDWRIRIEIQFENELPGDEAFGFQAGAQSALDQFIEAGGIVVAQQEPPVGPHERNGLGQDLEYHRHKEFAVIIIDLDLDVADKAHPHAAEQDVGPHPQSLE